MYTSFMGIYLIRMVRSVETKRMRGTKEKQDRPEIILIRIVELYFFGPFKSSRRRRISCLFSYYVYLVDLIHKSGRRSLHVMHILEDIHFLCKLENLSRLG
jgi:hypothetical protein